MSAGETNKLIIQDFFGNLNRGNLVEAFAALDDGLDWWILGTTKLSGTRDKRFISLGMKSLFQRTFKGFQFTLGVMTAEEDRVSVTAESDATHKNGKQYHNYYHFLFTLKDGKIAHVREYFDTAHADWVEIPP